MRMAVVGCGGMGRLYVRNYTQMPHVKLVGVCDVQPELANPVADIGKTTAFTSFEEMVAEVMPDVVSLCLPTHLHKTFVVKAASLGIHVICEKPAASSLAEAQEMIETCRAHGVRLFIAHVVRFFPSYRDIKRNVDAGVIGSLGLIHTKRFGVYPGGWYVDPAKSGGVIMDLMIHDIDYVRSLAGDVSTVFAMSRRTENKEYALVTLRFNNGVIANLEAHWGYPGPFTTAIEVTGRKGMVRYHTGEVTPLKIWKNTNPPTAGYQNVSVHESPAVHDPYYDELLHFIECIQQGKEAIVTAEDGLKAMEIAMAAMESIRSGMPVQLEERGSGT
ncbi:oxidoreductase [Paenibacillus sp. MY03]|nr:oxidoreductase [Paenibacillus sp. MY03]